MWSPWGWLWRTPGWGKGKVSTSIPFLSSSCRCLFIASRAEEQEKEPRKLQVSPWIHWCWEKGGLEVTSQRKKSRFSCPGCSLILSFCSVIIKKAGSVYHYLKEKTKQEKYFWKNMGSFMSTSSLKDLYQTFPRVNQKLGKFCVLKSSLFLLLF